MHSLGRIAKRLFALLASLILLSSACPAHAAESGAMKDIESHWGRAAIEYCLDGGYMKGTRPDTFLPNGSVTRGQVAQVLYNLAGVPETDGSGCPFRDIGDHWSRNAVEWAWSSSVVEGIGEKTFAPDAKITREQLVQMFRNYRQYAAGEAAEPNPAYLDAFTDWELISPWARDAAAWAVEYGLASGVGNDRFAPRKTCVRAELAQVVKNYFEPTPPPALGPGGEPVLSGCNSPLISYVRLSPNHSGPRNHKIDTITIHCMAESWSVERCGEAFADPERGASSNYGIGSDGRIALYVEECNRSWCTSNAENDNRAITIEVANTGGGPLWPVSDLAYEALIDLLTDICMRNEIPALLWQADPSLMGQIDRQNMTVHRWLDNKSCPGDFLFDHHGDIAERVNARLAQLRVDAAS